MNFSIKSLSVLLCTSGALLAVLFFFSFAGQSALAARPAPLPPGDKRVPILVELFTSEGCSSCPSADRLLSKLWREQPVAGVYIVPLSEHVDYWNYLGWQDPFSQESFTARQNAYQSNLQSDSVYTPQMVVGGRAGFAGSSEDQALAAIRQAEAVPKATLVLDDCKSAGGKLAFDLKISSIPYIYFGRPSLLTIAIADDGDTSKVTSGENAGAQLSHVSVARHLEIVKKIVPTTANFGPVSCLTHWTLQNENPEQHLIVFMQDEENGTVWGTVRNPINLR